VRNYTPPLLVESTEPKMADSVITTTPVHDPNGTVWHAYRSGVADPSCFPGQFWTALQNNNPLKRSRRRKDINHAIGFYSLAGSHLVKFGIKKR